MNNVSSSNSQKALVPELRFPEFSDRWESTKFADLFEFLSNNTLSRADLSDSGTVKNIHYGDVLIKFGDVVSAKDNTIPFIKDKTQLSKNTDYLKNGDIIIADTAEDDTVGKATEIQNISNESVVSGLHTIPCRAKERFAGGFLGYYLNSSAYHSQLYPLMQGIKVTSISKGNISKTKLKFPSVNEQGKIACMLSLIDKKIEAQKQMIDSLKLYKRGTLQQLFKLNSKGCKQFHLGELCNITTGKLDANAMIENGAYRFYTCAKEYYKIDKYAFDAEALLISGNGANVGYIHHYTGKFNAYQRTYVLTDFNSVNVDYLHYYLEAFLSKRIDSEKKAGNTPYIVLSTLSDMNIICPSIEKQISISKLFKSIDSKLNAEETIYYKLQDIKTGLLQKMFI